MLDYRILGKCYEECFRYYEAVCFKAYPGEYQTILLKTAFFPIINQELLMQVFDCSETDSKRILGDLCEVYGALIPQSEGEYVLEEFLRMFLQKRQTVYLNVGEMDRVYKKAYEYYVSGAKWKEAVRYAHLSGDIQGVVRCLHEALTENELEGCWQDLQPYLESVPEPYVTGDPVLLYAYAMLEALYGNKKESERYAGILERRRRETPEDSEEFALLQSACEFLQAHLPYREPEELFLWLEHTDGCRKYPWHRISLSSGQPSFLHGDRDFSIYMGGREALEKAAEGLKALMQDDCDGIQEVILGEVAYEKGDLDEAVTLLAKGLSSASGKNEETVYVASMLLAKIMYVRNQPEQARNVVRGMERRLAGSDSLYARANLEAFQLYIRMLQGESRAAADWARYSAPQEQDMFITLDSYCYMVKIYAYIMMDQTETALLILYRILAYAREYHRKYDELHMRLLEIIILYGKKGRKWVAMLGELLEETQQYGMVRLYADRGALLYPVLKSYEEYRKTEDTGRTIDPGYYKKIREQTGNLALVYPGFSTQKKEYEELNRHEQDVLRLLCGGLKNAEIADRLFVTENTVKYHLKKIYQKLQVGSRNEAVARAMELEMKGQE
ncbi:MAG: LuxR C-terminal-related transcriptional regulator [Kineothrix sp.]